jgi:hypothetical protein
MIYEYSLSFVPNTYTVKKQLFEKKKDSIEMIVLGTSRAFSGIIPSKMDNFSINLANNSQSLYYDIELLEKYTKNLPRLKTVVFDINFFSFEYNLDNGPEAWRALYYYNTFNIVPQTKKLSFFDNFLVKIYNPKDIIFHVGSRKLYSSYYRNKGYASNEATRVSLINNEDALKRYRHLTDNYMRVGDNIPTIEKLEGLMENLKNTQIKIVFVQIHVSPIMFNCIDENLLNETNDIINKICSKYPNVESINMLNDFRFSSRDFIDSDHLNERGALKFSTLLNTQLNTLHLD